MALVLTLNNQWSHSFMEEAIMSLFVFCVSVLIALACLSCEFCWCFVDDEPD